MGNPERPKHYEVTTKCDKCNGAIIKTFSIHPKRPKVVPLGDQDYVDNTKTIEIDQEILNEEFYAWINEEPTKDTVYKPRHSGKKAIQHHQRHHEKVVKAPPSYGYKTFNRTCCVDCDYPYEMYRRRYPPHLYNPENFKLPISYKKPEKRQKKRPTFSDIEKNATSFDKLGWAIANQQFEEAKRISTEMFATMLEDLRIKTINKHQ